jgi:hypothetical protein
MKNLIVTLVVALGMFGAFILGQNADKATGSVAAGSSYQYKAVSSAQASATVPVQVRGGRSVLGSIVVMGTSTVAIRIYDATTATSSATLIGTLPIGTTQGTYTFDIDMARGITLDVPAAYAGNLIVTSR